MVRLPRLGSSDPRLGEGDLGFEIHEAQGVGNVLGGRASPAVGDAPADGERVLGVTGEGPGDEQFAIQGADLEVDMRLDGDEGRQIPGLVQGIGEAHADARLFGLVVNREPGDAHVRDRPQGDAALQIALDAEGGCRDGHHEIDSSLRPLDDLRRELEASVPDVDPPLEVDGIPSGTQGRVPAQQVEGGDVLKPDGAFEQHPFGRAVVLRLEF
jgi:hypothetical protein